MNQVPSRAIFAAMHNKPELAAMNAVLLRRSPLPWVVPLSALALLAIFAVTLQPLLLPAAGGAVALGAALALAAPWRRFHAGAPAARAAFIGS
jgi:hypothetical protein